MISRLAVLGALAFLLLSRSAEADDQADFDKARAAYASKNYTDADQRLRAMLDPQTGTLKDPSLVPEARMYWAATYFARDKKPEAAAIIEQLLLAHPEYEPDPLRFPQDVVNFFIDTRSRIADKINAAKAAAARATQEAHDREVAERQRAAKRLALLEQMAGEEIEIKDHSRLFALMPFGAGQFQNGSTALGWTFLATESALFVASAVTIPVYRVQLAKSADYYNQGDDVSSDQWRSRASTTRDVNLVVAGAFVLTALVGIAQAEIAFVPNQIEIKKRSVPDVARLAPLVAPALRPLEGGGVPAVTGGVFGVQGAF